LFDPDLILSFTDLVISAFGVASCVEVGKNIMSSLTPPSEEGSKKKHSELENCAWPDSDPSFSYHGGVVVDDVSQMSATRVDRLFYPRTERDVETIVRLALQTGKRLSVRGTQHSMGGHCNQPGSFLVDTKYLGSMEYCHEEQTISVGVGVTWGDIISVLNEFGKSPQTMQSYASFSIGGTLAVNAHGITTDHSLAHDVVSFRLVRYKKEKNGEVAVETIVCSRENEHWELFSLVLGGYGLFGVVTNVTFRVSDNVDLELDSLQLCVTAGDDGVESEFVRVYDAVRANPDVNVKLARLNLSSLETASLYVFRAIRGQSAVKSNLPLKPRELSKASRLLYKWVLPILKSARFKQEEQSGSAVDFDDSTSRNSLLFESAAPLSRLYSPLVVVNDTFVLQEFFVPHDKFELWLKAVKQIYVDIENYQKNVGQSLILLNTSIRYVGFDDTTFLKYASAKDGMFAFVLYFRIKKNPEIEADLGLFHNRFAEEAVKLGGTFYLPYRKCYDQDLFERAYPNAREFALRKEQYDFWGIYGNQWFQEYLLLPYCSDGYVKAWARGPTPVQNTIDAAPAVVTREEFYLWLPRKDDPFLERRSNSFRKVSMDTKLRKLFAEQFLVNIFKVEKPAEVMRVISKAVWDPKNDNDQMIYRSIQTYFQTASARSPFDAVSKGWRSIRQLSRQKRELTRELAIILNRLGKFGRIHSYVSIGDHGKTVLNLQQVGAVTPAPSSKTYVVHDFQKGDETSLPCVLERGSLDPVGDIRIKYDYVCDKAAEKLGAVPTGSVELVTLNQGLHHFPRDRLYDFLLEVHRMLKVGGVFVFREHDLHLDQLHPTSTIESYKAPIEMLDAAHSVFNAITGVPPQNEMSEIRAFRPLGEWREMLSKVGFIDTMLFGFEDGDSTMDVMMCFHKGPIQMANPPLDLGKVPMRAEHNSFAVSEPAIAKTVKALLSQVPSSVVSIVKGSLSWMLKELPGIENNLSQLQAEISKSVSNNESDVIVAGIAGFVLEKLTSSMDRLQETASEALKLGGEIQVRESTNIAGLLSMPELYLVLPALRQKVVQHPDTSSEQEKLLIYFVEQYLPSLLLSASEKVDKEHRVDTTLVARKAKPPTETVSVEEVTIVIERLEKKIPGIFDPEEFLPQSGFGVAQQAALFGSLGAYDFVTFTTILAGYLDRPSWEELRNILVEKRRSVASCGDLPTKKRLLSYSLNHPWRSALLALLKSSKFQLSSQTLRGLRFLGLPEFVRLYESVKRESDNAPRVGHASRNDWLEMRRYMKAAISELSIKEVVLPFDRHNAEYELKDVGEITQAEFGYKSLTSSLTDVTQEVRHLHKISQGLKKDGQTTPVGWLPLQGATLEGFRNKTPASQANDSLRKLIVQAGSLGHAGQNVLRLKYRPVAKRISEKENLRDRQLCALLERTNIIEQVPNSQKHYAWFRLSEWMQVEIIENLGRSLEHTPWYFYPFNEFVNLYFRILFQECSVVASEHGFMKAYASLAFITYLVPGVVMAVLFGQLQLLANPLVSLLPEYSDDVKVEEVVFLASAPQGCTDDNATKYFCEEVDSRFREVNLLWQDDDNSLPSLYRAVIPTYKAMSEILINLGQRQPSARILQISGSKVSQVRISVEAQVLGSTSHGLLDQVKTDLQSIAGVVCLFEYRFPNNNRAHRMNGETEDKYVQLALRVDVSSLLALIRMISHMETVQIEQIYEFWTGW
jgi:SAM-dependent methyltransferase